MTKRGSGMSGVSRGQLAVGNFVGEMPFGEETSWGQLINACLAFPSVKATDVPNTPSPARVNRAMAGRWML